MPSLSRTRLLRGLLVSCALCALFAGCGGGADSASTPLAPAAGRPGVLSLTSSPRSEPPATNPARQLSLQAEAASLAYGIGARGHIVTHTWREFEPASPGLDPDVASEIQLALDAARAGSLTLYLGIAVVNTSVKELPLDLAGRAFDDPVVRVRFHALLDRLVGANPGRFRYLSIGNEVDEYLSAHPGEQAAYRAFYRDAAQYARSLDPALQVGVTGTAEGALGSHAASLQDLISAGSDVVMLNYYPMQGDATGLASVREPSVVASDFAGMLAFAGARPLLMQEVGYPASTVLNSSEAKQAAFVSQVFAAWKASNGRIPFLNVFLLHDLAPQTCDDLLVYYGLSLSHNYGAFLCSLGLRRADGTPRLAWQTLSDEARLAHLP
ncbi:MAG: hypothetical protein ABI699_00825 [Caldimonas sp.]